MRAGALISLRLIWKLLAPEFGITDEALAKTCRKHGILRPGRGYWARLAAGAKDPQPPLPEAEAWEEEVILLRRIEGPVEPKVAATRPPHVPVPKPLEPAAERGEPVDVS